MSTEVLEEVSEELKTAEEPVEAEKNRGGRPLGAKNKGPSPTFFDRLKDIDWQRHTAFIYRLQPLIDRTVGGEPKYIDKYGEPFDEDRVMHDHGSGVYQVRLTELQGKTGKSTQIDSYNFEIYNMKFPPQCPVGVWLDDHRNERWKWAKEPLTAEQTGKPADNRSNGGGGGTDLTKFAKEIFQEARQDRVNPNDQFKAQTEIYKMGLADAKAQAPAAVANDGLALLEKLLPLLSQPKDDSVVKVLTLQLEAEREQRKADREQAKIDREAADKRAESAEKRHNDLMQTLIAKKENSGTDVIQQFTSMFNMFKGITEGGLGATDDSWTGILKEGVREALPHIAPSLAPMIGGMVTGAAQFAGGGPRPTPGPQRLPPPPANATQPPTAEQPPPVDPHIAAYQCVFMNQAALLKAVKDGKPGIEFGDWLVEGNGPLEIEKLKAAGVDRIVAFISQQIPPLWAELQPFEMKFRAFLSELMSWTPAEEDDPDEPPAEGIPGPAPVFPGGKKTGKTAKKGAN